MTPSEPRFLKVVRSFVRSILDEAWADELDRIVLAVDACGANLIRHRCSTLCDGYLRLRVTLGEDRATFTFGRFCRTGEEGSIQPRDLKEVRPGGLGTHFLQSVADGVRYVPDPDDDQILALEFTKLRAANRERTDDHAT